MGARDRPVFCPVSELTAAGGGKRGRNVARPTRGTLRHPSPSSPSAPVGRLGPLVPVPAALGPVWHPPGTGERHRQYFLAIHRPRRDTYA